MVPYLAETYATLSQRLVYIETQAATVDPGVKSDVCNTLKMLKENSKILEVHGYWWIVYIDGSTRKACEYEIQEAKANRESTLQQPHPPSDLDALLSLEHFERASCS